MNWFGEDWGAPCCDPQQHVGTPMGCRCMECRTPIGEQDQGFTTVTYVQEERIAVAYHRVCFLRTVVPCEMWEHLPELLENMPEHWKKHREENHDRVTP